MIENIGIGVDISYISDFKKLKYTHKKKFYQKYFSQSEINYCLKYKDPYPHFAGKFAVKEAVIKAIQKNISLKNIITYHKNRKPNVRIKKINENYKFLISISHEKDFAIAVVISELSQ